MTDSPQLYTLECATKHRYYCYPITFEDNGLYENVSLDENGVPIVKQGDVIDTVNFTTMTDTQKIDSIMNINYLKAGSIIKKSDILFKKIENDS